MRYYLAYGSNLNLVQMGARCPEALPLGWTFLDGYGLLYRGSRTGAYLTIEKMEGQKVPVGVFGVTPSDEKKLDRYEGFPAFYYKKDFTVIVHRKKVKAFAYIMHEDRPYGLPTEFYEDVCLEGYADFGFDLKILWEAKERTKEAMRCMKTI